MEGEHVSVRRGGILFELLRFLPTILDRFIHQIPMIFWILLSSMMMLVQERLNRVTEATKCKKRWNLV